MYIDEWATAISTLDIPGVDVEDLLLLINWTSRNMYNIRCRFPCRTRTAQNWRLLCASRAVTYRHTKSARCGQNIK